MEDNTTLFEGGSLQNFVQKVRFVFPQVFFSKRQTRGNSSGGRGSDLGRFPYGSLNMCAAQGALRLAM